MLIETNSTSQIHVDLKNLGIYVDKSDIDIVIHIIKEMAFNDLKAVLKDFSLEDLLDKKKAVSFGRKVSKIFYYDSLELNYSFFSNPKSIKDSWIRANMVSILNALDNYLVSSEITKREEKQIEKAFALQMVSGLNVYFPEIPSLKKCFFEVMINANLLSKDIIAANMNATRVNIKARELLNLYTRAKEQGYLTRDFRYDFYSKILTKTLKINEEENSYSWDFNVNLNRYRTSFNKNFEMLVNEFEITEFEKDSFTFQF